MQQLRRATYRIPADVAAYLDRVSERNLTSVNAEIVRAVRERMERMKPATGGEFGDMTPAAGPNETADQGGLITHGL